VLFLFLFFKNLLENNEKNVFLLADLFNEVIDLTEKSAKVPLCGT
jgi:hypothetical protein